MVLVVTNSQDATVDFFLRNVHRPFFRFDTDHFLTRYELTYGPESWELLDRTSGEAISNKNLIGIYYRRPVAPKVSFEGSNPELDQDLAIEAKKIYLSFIQTQQTKWLSSPASIERAENKLWQLKAAAQVGFLVPDFTITNNLVHLREFTERHNRTCIKPLHLGPFELDGETYVPYTAVLSEYDSLDSVGDFPVFAQEYVEKDTEFRVTLVGNALFAVEIDSQSNDETKQDWRVGNCLLVDYSRVTLPKKIEKLCRSLVERANISFSAIDLVKDKTGRFYFLDLNPNGQWAWIDEMLSLGIAKSIEDYFYE